MPGPDLMHVLNFILLTTQNFGVSEAQPEIFYFRCYRGVSVSQGTCLLAADPNEAHLEPLVPTSKQNVFQVLNEGQIRVVNRQIHVAQLQDMCTDYTAVCPRKPKDPEWSLLLWSSHSIGNMCPPALTPHSSALSDPCSPV